MGKDGGFHQRANAPKKVDQVIIYNLFVLGRLTSTNYSDVPGRRYKYMAIKDHILLSIDPLLVPKVKATEQAWADRYKELIEKIKQVNVYSDTGCDEFFDLLQQFMQLFATVLYSTGHYELENISDDDYEKYYMDSYIGGGDGDVQEDA